MKYILYYEYINLYTIEFNYIKYFNNTNEFNLFYVFILFIL